MGAVLSGKELHRRWAQIGSLGSVMVSMEVIGRKYFIPLSSLIVVLKKCAFCSCLGLN